MNYTGSFFEEVGLFIDAGQNVGELVFAMQTMYEAAIFWNISRIPLSLPSSFSDLKVKRFEKKFKLPRVQITKNSK